MTHTHPHTRDGEIDLGVSSPRAAANEHSDNDAGARLYTPIHAYTRTACTVGCTHKHLDHVIFAIHLVLAGGLESGDTEAGSGS